MINWYLVLAVIAGNLIFQPLFLGRTFWDGLVIGVIAALLVMLANWLGVARPAKPRRQDPPKGP